MEKSLLTNEAPKMRLLKANEVAQILGVSKALVYKLMRTGELPNVRILSARRIRKEDLDQFILNNVSE